MNDFARCNSKSTLTFVREMGWARGIRSGVRLAAWIAARRATPSTSPFFAPPLATRRSVAGFMWMRPEATATRRVLALPPTSTMWASPRASKCVSLFLMVFFFMTGRYHKRMRRLAFFLLAILAPSGMAQPLPDLGGPGDAALAPALERRIGESIVRDIRRDPTYVDDPEVAEYLASVGGKLTQVSGGGRQDFEFFAVRDPAINAFALPGGFVGVHTGLVTSAETESEMASVVAHEIAHVTQRHIARLFGTQQQMNMPVMVALAAAILLGRSRPDLASGAAAAAQGVAAATTLSYTRDFEREADRVGLQSLAAAGFEPRAMSAFFERMQRSQRVADDGTVPGYLRTHPVTTERIADAQNRAATLPYKQHLASAEFHLVRAKLRAEAGDPHDTVTSLQSAVRDG